MNLPVGSLLQEAEDKEANRIKDITKNYKVAAEGLGFRGSGLRGLDFKTGSTWAL